MSWHDFWRHAFATGAEGTALEPEDERLAVDIAGRLEARHLSMPTLVLVESTKPLANAAAQLLIFLDPILSPFLSEAERKRLRTLLENPRFLERLCLELESHSSRTPPESPQEIPESSS